VRARHAPCLNCNFLVDLGTRDPRDPAAGFSEVLLPGFPVASRETKPSKGSPTAAPWPDPATTGSPESARRTLVLRRGFDGSLDLVDWWNEARRGKASASRSVAVHLLADDHATVLVTWRFRNARPVALGYSALSAADPAVLVESIELTFEAAEILGARGGTAAFAAPRAARSRARARS